MRLYDEIFKTADGMALSRCAFVPEGEGYFEGVKAVEDFSFSRVVLCFSKQRIAIEGERLTIGKYCDGDLQLHGKITSVRVLGEEKDDEKNETDDKITRRQGKR
jgi:hypothetical protein